MKRGREWGSTSTKTGISTAVTGPTTDLMGTAATSTPQERGTRVSSKMGSSMARESIDTLVGTLTMENGHLITKMGSDSIPILKLKVFFG